MVTASQLSINLKSLLKQNNIENYIFESRCIIEFVLNIPYNRLRINPDMVVSEDAVNKIRKIANKRISGYPLQYLLGQWEFFGLPFYVGEGVLIPRQDTETLVESVLNHVQTLNLTKPSVLDLCSGTGCIAIALEKNILSANVCAAELSTTALSYLTKNISLNSSSVTVYNGDVLDEKFAGLFSSLDIITSNPPYLTKKDMQVIPEEVKHEPSMALFGGDNGLLFYEKITAIWKHCLKPGGAIFYEIGMGQETDVANILKENNFIDITFNHDLNGIIRVVSGVYN
ncbi:MAG: peptide chain release factor N(5)-glutamine methyltransferase [Oscillospiraceae bacterium]|nr:peptide chain release factor N(5)-glutamine methyltransferase [Oscillospiraceae bacterium]